MPAARPPHSALPLAHFPKAVARASVPHSAQILAMAFLSHPPPQVPGPGLTRQRSWEEGEAKPCPVWETQGRGMRACLTLSPLPQKCSDPQWASWSFPLQSCEACHDSCPFSAPQTLCWSGQMPPCSPTDFPELGVSSQGQGTLATPWEPQRQSSQPRAEYTVGV